MICCCLMIWVPFSAMRNVHLQLPFVFSFSPFFFFPQSLCYYFLSPCTKNNLLIILVILYTLHDSLPFLFEVGGAKGTVSKATLHCGFQHWYNDIFCVTSYFLYNSKCWFIIFSPATELMFSRSIFQRPHEQGVILFKMLVSVFLHGFTCCHRSMLEGIAWHLYRHLYS